MEGAWPGIPGDRRSRSHLDAEQGRFSSFPAHPPPPTAGYVPGLEKILG